MCALSFVLLSCWANVEGTNEASNYFELRLHGGLSLHSLLLFVVFVQRKPMDNNASALSDSVFIGVFIFSN